MKIHVYWMILIAVVVSCKKELADVPVITMISKASEPNIYIAGSGSVSIDWGDGKAVETHTLYPYNYDIWEWLSINEESYIYKFGHSFEFGHSFDQFAYTITIKGENITHLNCAGIRLTNLYVNKNKALKALNCSNNNLMEIDVKNNTELLGLHCDDNLLSNIDVSNNTALKELHCRSNQLNSLDLSSNTELVCLWILSNQLSASALDNLFETLNDKFGPRKNVWIYSNPGADDCDLNIASDKHWYVNKWAGAVHWPINTGSIFSSVTNTCGNSFPYEESNL